MATQDGDLSMQAPAAVLQRELLSDIEWSRSRTMTMNSMYTPTQITCCLNLIAFLWKWSKPLIAVWIIAVESFLLIEIYWDHSTYFRLSTTFISTPLLISSIFIAYTSYQSITSRFDSDRITHFSGARRKCLELLLITPILNVLMVLLPPPTVLIKNRVHYTLAWQSIFILSLSICMTLPQFILNICFILSYDTIPLYNWLQIITCVISLSVFSLFHYAHTYALDSIGETIPFLNAIKLQLFWTKFQYFAEIFFYIYFITIVLELIHCLPLLFEYFYYHNITLQTLMYVLIAFNGAKLLSFAPYIYNISIYKKTNCCSNCIRFISLLIIFIPLPLFPFMTITYKSLFEKRVLLIEKKPVNVIKTANIHPQPQTTIKNTLTNSLTFRTNTNTESVDIYLRKSTDNIDMLDENNDTDELDIFNTDGITPMFKPIADSEINERSPIHKTSAGSASDLRIYHTMDSTQQMHDDGTGFNYSNDTLDLNMNMNDGYHFEQYESMRSIQCQYFLLVLYLLVAYIGCNAFLIVNCGGIFCLGFKTQIMMYVSFGCVFIAAIIYSPFVLKTVLNKAQLVLIGDELSHDDWDWI